MQLLADAVAAPSRPRAADDSFTTEGRDATIARVASDDPSEVEVDWGYKDRTDHDVQALAGALEHNTHVRRLDLRCNKRLTDAGARALLAVLPFCAVTAVDVEYCDGRYDGSAQPGVSAALRAEIKEALLPRIIAQVADDEPQRTELDLRDMELKDEHCEALAGALSANRTLRTLRLGGNRELTDAGLRIVVAALPECGSLTEIDLCHRLLLNETLTDAGVESLLAVLPFCAVGTVRLAYLDRVYVELKEAVAVTP